MQDGFLFDDADPGQRGRGCDQLGTRRDGLRFLWRWIETRGEGRPLGEKSKRLRVPCQVCSSRLPRMDALKDGGPYPELEVIFWHTEYEARLRICGKHIFSEMGFKTRVAAQRAAEKYPGRLATALRRSAREADVRR